MLMISLTYFFIFHVTLLMYNLTTIDYIEKGKDEISNTSTNIYFKGICESITEVMGNCCSIWLPIAVESQYKGYSFEIDKNLYNQILLEKLKEKEENKNRSIFKI